MNTEKPTKRIAIVGGGPSGLFLFKRLLEKEYTDISIDIFEAANELGTGMPYSHEGANKEHITNVSGNEIPPLVTTVMEWLATLPHQTLAAYNLDLNKFSEYRVLPRLLFGQYLKAQFELLLQQAKMIGLQTKVYYNSTVTDITDEPETDRVLVQINKADNRPYEHVIICTGHSWPTKYEGKISGYFDSPYPPSKLAALHLNHAVAIKGSSLTAIDAIRTLARSHGSFVQANGRTVAYNANADTPDFKIIMHSRQGLLPGIRFHLSDPHLEEDNILTQDEVDQHIQANGGFLSLDYIFEKDFKDGLKEKDPALYERVKNMAMEELVEAVMSMREKIDPFELFKMEYAEAEKSIRRKESVYWKEMLAALSFAMNYPAKHFSAEDMQRLQKVLMPLISVVIAFVPQSSCEEMIALHEAGLLELVSVGDDSHVEPHPDGGAVYHYTDDSGKNKQIHYHTYIDGTGQKHLSLEDLPFKSLIKNDTLSNARLTFRDPTCGLAMYDAEAEHIEKEGDSFYLKVSGITITDSFNVVGKNGQPNPRVYMMAVSYMGGFNPDYSGLDFGEEASERIVEDMLRG